MDRYLRTLVVVGAIAGVTRLAASEPLLAAWAVAVVAGTATAAGVFAHRHRHDAIWRRAWTAIVLAVAATGTAAVTRVGEAADAVTSHAWALAGALLLVAGATLLLRHRLSAPRAIDLLVEAAIGSMAAGFLAWGLVLLPVEGAIAAGDAPRLLVPLALLVGVWLLVRLILLTDERPRAYLYLVVAAVTALAASLVPVVTMLGAAGDHVVDPGALLLWSLCLFAAAALHPTTADSFGPVPVRPATLGWGHVLLVVAGLLLTPAVIAWQLGTGNAPTSLVLVGMTVFPLLVVTHLVWQVRERATGEYRAQHDALTGLPNRVLFEDRLEVALAYARRSGAPLGVMFLDLDRFKQINDSLGHDTGDQLLRSVAWRLRQALREQDTIARVGGDEFTILVTDVEGRDACAVVAQKVLGVFGAPFVVGGRELTISASIGVAVYPVDGEDPDTLIKNADTAMYGAKARSRNTVQLYTSEMSAQAQVRLALESGLRTAMDRSQLTLHYQPRVNQVTGRIVGVEALARWKHPRLGYISPGVFITVAEDTGLIDRLGRWVLSTAVQQLQEWRRRGILDVPVSVNVSARQFNDAEDLERAVTDTLQRTGLPPAHLELELTETVLLQDRRGVAQALRNLRELGVRIAIDDFGTGYSGLLYLTAVPVDNLKIDRAFVATIVSESDRAPIVEAVLALGRNLELGVVAEGVETEAQARFLRARGCEEVQGFLFARPLASDQLEEAVLASVREGSSLGAVLSGVAVPGTARLSVPGAPPALDSGAVNRVLESATRSGDPERIDPELLAAVLGSLLPREAQPALFSSNSLSVRLAAGRLV